MLESLDSLIIILLGITPGFVLFLVLRQQTGDSTERAEILVLLQSLLGTAIVYAAIAPLYIVASNNWPEFIPRLTISDVSALNFVQYVGLMLTILILPAIIGWTVGWLLTCQWTQSALSRVKMDSLSRAPSAWDGRVFARKEPAYLIVETDEAYFFGVLDQRGAVGSWSNGGDLYLSPQYLVNDCKEWISMGEGSSVWIRGERIVSVAIRKGESS